MKDEEIVEYINTNELAGDEDWNDKLNLIIQNAKENKQNEVYNLILALDADIETQNKIKTLVEDLWIDILETEQKKKIEKLEKKTVKFELNNTSKPLPPANKKEEVEEDIFENASNSNCPLPISNDNEDIKSILQTHEKIIYKFGVSLTIAIGLGILGTVLSGILWFMI